MLNHDPINDFLLHTFLPCRFQVGLSIRTRPFLPPNLHCGGVLIIKPPSYTDAFQNRTPREGNELGIVVRGAEVEYAETSVILLVYGWLNDPLRKSNHKGCWMF